MGAHSRRSTHTRPHSRATRWLTAGLIIIGALAVLTTLALWPRGDTPELGIPPRDFVDATVVGIDSDTCPALDIGRPEMDVGCTIYLAELTSGDQAGSQFCGRLAAGVSCVPW
jgi:hypothetical protein